MPTLVGIGTYTAIASQAIITGTLNFVPITLAPNITHALLQVDRTTWTGFDATVTIGVDISHDNGGTWTNIGGLSTQCGPCSHDGVTPINVVGSDFVVPGQGTATRQLRGSLTLNGTGKSSSLVIVFS